MAVNLTNADKALKTYYLDAVAQQLDVISPFYAKIKKSTDDVWGKEVKKLVCYGVNGGVGAGSGFSGFSARSVRISGSSSGCRASGSGSGLAGGSGGVSSFFLFPTPFGSAPSTTITSPPAATTMETGRL